MPDVSTDVELVRELFVARERWGWEYVDPDPAVRLDPTARPVWLEPPGPDLTQLQQQAARGATGLLLRLVVVVVVCMVMSIASAGAGMLVLFVGGALALAPWLLPASQISSAKRTAQERRAAAWTAFQQADQAWLWQAESVWRSEEARRAAAMLWFPVDLTSGRGRVDVFGGTGEGWASLLTTVGASLLAGGRNVLVLDLSEAQVAVSLARLADSWGVPVVDLEFPKDQARLDLLRDLPAEELAEVLTEALGSMRPGPAQVDIRALDAELLRTVAGRLDSPVTASRLAAGLNVLRHAYDSGGSGFLSEDELARLTSCVDSVGGRRDQVQQELQLLAVMVGLLAEIEESASEAEQQVGLEHGLWPRNGLAVISTSTSNLRRKDVLDRVVFARALHELRLREADGAGDVLVIAGADLLGRENLEAVARQARRVGVRLVLLMERLHNELREHLGSSDSVAVLMRLGNAQDAAAAAEFIGRGHRFVLSELTAQIGRTSTSGSSTSTGDAIGTTATKGTNPTWAKVR